MFYYMALLVGGVTAIHWAVSLSNKRYVTNHFDKETELPPVMPLKLDYVQLEKEMEEEFKAIDESMFPIGVQRNLRLINQVIIRERAIEIMRDALL